MLSFVALACALLTSCSDDAPPPPPPLPDEDASVDTSEDTMDEDAAPDAEADAEIDSGADAQTDSAMDATVDSDPSEPSQRVFFMGNSYTFFNELPALVDEIGDASGAPLEVEAILEGGATLMQHGANPAIAEMLSTGFDFVVVQGQSTEAFNQASFIDAATPVADAVADAESQGVWFAHWSRRDIDVEPLPGTRAIESSYGAAAALHDDIVARVGEAFLIAERDLPDVELLDFDRSHPSPEGSLLAACVIFRAITGVDPVLPDGVSELGEDQAQALCDIANGGVPCNVEELVCGDECIGVEDECDE